MSILVVRNLLRELGIYLNLSSVELEEEFENFLFLKLKEAFSIIGSANECDELEKILSEKLRDPEERKRLAEYIQYLLVKFLEFRRKMKEKYEVEEGVYV